MKEILVYILALVCVVCAGSLETATSTSEFPQNITDVFRGQWKPIENDSALAIETIERASWFGLTKQEGRVAFQFFAESVNHSQARLHLVKGEMELRNGNYSTSTRFRYEIQGMYFWQNGLLYLEANPKDRSPIIHDHLFEFDNVTLDEIKAMLHSQFLTADTSFNAYNTNPSDCVFKGLFQFAKTSDPPRAFIESLDEDNGSPRPVLRMHGHLSSPNCNLLFKVDEAASFPFETYAKKAVKYLFLVAIGSIVEILLTIRQMDYSNTQAALIRITMWSLGIPAVLDCFIFLSHLLIGIVVSPIFNTFALVSFLKFIGFSIFEMRFILQVWKAHRPGTDGWDVIRNEISLMYIRLYGLLMLGFAGMYYFNSLLLVFAFVLCSFWIPQIIYNVRRDCNRPFMRSYVLGTSITRAFILVYFIGCPYNFIQIEPNTTAAIILCCYVAAQVLFLLAQDRWGPRFFLPKALRPEQYDYLRPVPEQPDNQKYECVICMNTVDTSTPRYMITPCNHVFHMDCLVRWLGYKMECPTCRRSLPTPPASLLQRHELSSQHRDDDIV